MISLAGFDLPLVPLDFEDTDLSNIVSTPVSVDNKELSCGLILEPRIENLSNCDTEKVNLAFLFSLFIESARIT